jgi:lipoprotein-anchoring transpeptidase ErfK/SrfK
MTSKLGHVTLVAVVVIGVMLIPAVRALPGWAGWNDITGAGETATPTRTPRPVTSEPVAARLSLTVVAPAVPTGGPPAAPTPVPVPAHLAPALANGLTPYLAPIVARYGIDPTRRFMVVDPNSQRMTVWEPGRPIRELPISTGDVSQGWRTAAWYGLVGQYVGTFQSFGVYADDAWYLFEDKGKILIHSAPYQLVDGKKQYEELDALGSYPASRGCIRLHPDDARWLTSWDPEGVPLVILPREDTPKA